MGFFRKKKKKAGMWGCKNTCTGGGIYCLGFIGAAVYYIQSTSGFWVGVLGFLKALVWPAFLIYEALKFLGM